MSGGVPIQCDCEAVHVLEDQFKLALGKAFCAQEPMSRSDEFANFVILHATDAEDKAIPHHTAWTRAQREEIMLLRLAISAITVAAIASTATYAQNASFGSPAEAKAMLEKVVISMKADPAKTIGQIKNGEGGFRDRDLYPTCAGPDGKNIAHPDPARIGLVQRDIKDVTGKPYGAEFASAVEDKITEVTYLYPRPGEDKTPVEKVGLATKVAGYTCVVGYYK